MHHPRKNLETFDDVVAALGGLAAVGLLCDDQDVAAVCNWKRRRSRFPTKYYKRMIAKLDEQGASAPDHLWGMAETKKSNADAA